MAQTHTHTHNDGTAATQQLQLDKRNAPLHIKRRLHTATVRGCSPTTPRRCGRSAPKHFLQQSSLQARPWVACGGGRRFELATDDQPSFMSRDRVQPKQACVIVQETKRPRNTACETCPKNRRNMSLSALLSTCPHGSSEQAWSKSKPMAVKPRLTVTGGVSQEIAEQWASPSRLDEPGTWSARRLAGQSALRHMQGAQTTGVRTPRLLRRVRQVEPLEVRQRASGPTGQMSLTFCEFGDDSNVAAKVSDAYNLQAVQDFSSDHANLSCFALSRLGTACPGQCTPEPCAVAEQTSDSTGTAAAFRLSIIQAFPHLEHANAPFST